MSSEGNNGQSTMCIILTSGVSQQQIAECDAFWDGEQTVCFYYYLRNKRIVGEWYFVGKQSEWNRLEFMNDCRETKTGQN